MRPDVQSSGADRAGGGQDGTPARAGRLAYAVVASPDLDAAERFWTAFGLTTTERSEARLYLRSTAGDPYVCVVEKGDPRVIGLGFSLDDEGSLEAAARLPAASPIHSHDHPGGGSCVTVADPLGYRLELVHGRRDTPELPVSYSPCNSSVEPYRRVGTPARPPRGPAKVRRLGHAVLVTPEVEEVTSWYQRNLGLRCSDVLREPEGHRTVGTFLRVDRGSEYVDHHVLNLTDGSRRGVNHLAFEVRDFDDVMTGHEHLAAAGYQHARGPGRHVIGSQVFDYWLDPWGLMVEHYTDTDMMNDQAEAGEYAVGGTDSPWGASSSPAAKKLIFP